MTERNLLLLDNDERIVELLHWYLESRGYRVRSAGSFVEARERLAEKRPDLLVSDVDLGSESAVVELPRMSAAGELPPTLVVSGFLDASVREVLDAVPEILGTVAKPFEFDDLEASIRSCLERSGELAEHPHEPAPPVTHEPAPAAEGATPGPAPEDAGADADDDGWIEIRPR